MAQQINSTQPIQPTSFMGGFNSFLGGVTDTFGTLLEGGLMFEQYRAQKDSSRQGQADAVNAVERPNNPNAAPISPNQYNAVAQGAKATGGAMSTNAMMIAGGVALLALVVVMRK